MVVTVTINGEPVTADPYILIGAFDYLQPPDRIQALLAGELQLRFDGISSICFQRLFDWHEKASRRESWTLPTLENDFGGMFLAATVL